VSNDKVSHAADKGTNAKYRKGVGCSWGCLVAQRGVAVAASTVSVAHLEVLTLMVERHALAVRTCTRYHRRVSRCVLVVSHEDDCLHLHASVASSSNPRIVTQLTVACLPDVALIT